jgi:hypothetical protein
MSVVSGEDDEEEICQAIYAPAAVLAPGILASHWFSRTRQSCLDYVSVSVPDASINLADSKIQSAPSCESSSATIASASSDAIQDIAVSNDAVSVNTEHLVSTSASGSAGAVIGNHDSFVLNSLMLVTLPSCLYLYHIQVKLKKSQCAARLCIDM